MFVFMLSWNQALGPRLHNKKGGALRGVCEYGIEVGNPPIGNKLFLTVDLV